MGNGNVYRPEIVRHRTDCEVRKNGDREAPCDCPRVKSGVWWLTYSAGRKRHRESSGFTKKADALDLLHQRVGDRKAGKLIGRPETVTLAQLHTLVERQYVLDKRKSVKRVNEAFTNLEAFFGAETPVVAITETRIDEYAQRRMETDGRARATVNNELAQLRRGFNLAIEKKLLAVMPIFKLPKVQNARQGFFDDGDFAALLLELPAVLRPLIQFLWYTGWRCSEGRLLTWAQVDRDACEVQISGSRTKSGKPRVFPFRLAPPLKELLEAQWDGRASVFVFHDNGKPIGVGKLRCGWKRATKRAGLVGRLVHDLRRSAARESRRNGMSESDIMEVSGWETRETFKRYCIRDPKALEDSVGKRFHVQHRSNIPPAPVSPNSLSSDAAA